MKKKILQRCPKCHHGFFKGELHDCKFLELYHKPREFKSDGYEEENIGYKCRYCKFNFRPTGQGDLTCFKCREERRIESDLVQMGRITLKEFNKKWYN